jgi:hypothetical protein
MPYSLKQAATACGRSKSTVYAALKSGALKHELDEKGRFIIRAEDLEAVFPKHSGNVQEEREKTEPNDEKNSLFLQKIAFLEQTVTNLTEERDQWREQAKAASATIEKQAASLATATAASARAITQADEIRRQLLAIEAATAPPTPEPAPSDRDAVTVRSIFWWALALAASAAALLWWFQPWNPTK